MIVVSEELYKTVKDLDIPIQKCPECGTEYIVMAVVYVVKKGKHPHGIFCPVCGNRVIPKLQAHQPAKDYM